MDPDNEHDDVRSDDGAFDPPDSDDAVGQLRMLEEEVASLRRRLQDAPKRVRVLEERLLETKGQLAQAVSRNEKLTYTLENPKPVAAPAAAAPPPRADTDSIEQLADAVAGLVAQMREEQKLVRQWAQGQQTQQNEIQRLLIRATGPLSRGAARSKEDERP